MKGDFVVLRAYGGPVVRRVVEVVGDFVYIASDEQFARLIGGLPADDPVGFHRRDVFQYEPKVEKDISRGKVEWNRLTPYTEESEAREKA